jgi:KUP system potassium uptake protein
MISTGNINDDISNFHRKMTFGGALIAIGVVFGDLGASPLYTYNAVFHDRVINETIALGSLSCVFWTLFFLTTIKYIIITLQADNKGEGGILSLYALIRRYWGKWLIYPAMAGAAFLMADGIVTPPISVASAVEGVRSVLPGLNTVPIIVGILIGLFMFQQFGSHSIGKVFGPAMMIWFGFIAFLGIWALKDNWSALRALNPYYAYQMLVLEPGGFWLLGGIFLCATGAEALYSDMGHVGRNNIRISWAFIKVALILCYAGQTAWLLDHVGETIGEISPFYHIVPKSIYWFALVIATLATVIASQSLISGCFTLVNEAIRLDIWPGHKVLFPGNFKGQLYIPAINWFLMCGCVGMVLHFKESTRMEAAFGLSVTLTMLISTILVAFYLRVKKISIVWISIMVTVFLSIEVSFLVANLTKFKDGGWITVLIGIIIFSMMMIWWKGHKMKNKLTKIVEIDKFVPVLKELSEDQQIPKFATNLVYLNSSGKSRKVEKHLLDSILHYGIPKRADNYWFVHVNVLDQPHGLSYTVDTVAENDIYFICFNIGFKVEPRLDHYFRVIVKELIKNEEVDVSERSEYTYQKTSIGDFKFVVRQSFLSYDNKMPFWINFIMRSFYNLKYLSVKEEVNFGLDQSNVVIEKYPLVVVPYEPPVFEREEPANAK